MFSPRDKPRFRFSLASACTALTTQHDPGSQVASRAALYKLTVTPRITAHCVALDESVLLCALESVLVTSVVIVENIYKERDPCMCGV